MLAGLGAKALKIHKSKIKMNKSQLAKLAMYGSTEELLKAIVATSSIVGLPAKLTVYTNKLSALQALEGIQAQPTEGETKSRDDVLDHLIASTLKLAGIVGAYAHDQKLSELSALVDVQRHDFEALRIAQRPLLAQRVHDATEGVMTPLAHPEVTVETLAAFQEEIDAARQKIKQPRMTVVTKRGATSELAKSFREFESFLTGQIDRLVLPLEQTNSGLYARYLAARTIVNVPGVRSAPDPDPTSTTTAPAAAAPAAPASPPGTEPKAA
jgi:hypothetical protein